MMWVLLCAAGVSFLLFLSINDLAKRKKQAAREGY